MAEPPFQIFSESAAPPRIPATLARTKAMLNIIEGVIQKKNVIYCFDAQNEEIENIKTGRQIFLVRRQTPLTKQVSTLATIQLFSDDGKKSVVCEVVSRCEEQENVKFAIQFKKAINR